MVENNSDQQKNGENMSQDTSPQDNEKKPEEKPTTKDNQADTGDHNKSAE